MDVISSLNSRIKMPAIAEMTKDQQPSTETAAVPSFEDTLKSFVKETNELQQESGTAARQLISGQTNDMHQVMIVGEKAGIAFSLLLEVRNRLMEGYQELNRMQV